MTTLNIKGFPEDLYKALVDLAKTEHRSLTQEVIYLLQIAIKQSEKQKPSILNFRGLGKKLWTDVDLENHINLERDTWD
ncbi:MAG: hypothetical protein H0W50_04155 [Parachlamydiaceae bacterium]|nr:hypothetical protein [Parachlamydiaceae bacterium]